jgi:hypothetical protein
MLRDISVISVGECGGERTVEEDHDVNERASERQASPARFSLHALLRAARRNVVPDAIEYVLTYGRVLHRTGITFHFLAARDVPTEDRRAAWSARLVGTVVLVGADGGIITVYRNRRALPAIRRKLKYRIAVGAVPAATEMLGLEDGERPLTA